MSEQLGSPNPEQVTPGTLSQLIRSSQAILDQLGIEEPSVGLPEHTMQKATVAIDTPTLTTAREGALPTVSINSPTGDFAKKSRWSYEITYGMQDPSSSRHILVMNDEIPQAEMSFYDGREDRSLTEAEAQAAVADLGSLAGQE